MDSSLEETQATLLMLGFKRYIYTNPPYNNYKRCYIHRHLLIVVCCYITTIEPHKCELYYVAKKMQDITKNYETYRELICDIKRALKVAMKK